MGIFKQPTNNMKNNYVKEYEKCVYNIFYQGARSVFPFILRHLCKARRKCQPKNHNFLRLSEDHMSINTVENHFRPLPRSVFLERKRIHWPNFNVDLWQNKALNSFVPRTTMPYSSSSPSRYTLYHSYILSPVELLGKLARVTPAKDSPPHAFIYEYMLLPPTLQRITTRARKSC